MKKSIFETYGMIADVTLQKEKEEKEKTKLIIITPKQFKRLKLGLAERTKIRNRREKERREQYYK